MNYCTICDQEFTDINKHINKYHKSAKMDTGYLLNWYDEYKKRLYTVEDFLRHFEKFNTEDIYNALRTAIGEEEDPYWLTARQWLTKDEYDILKEKVYGKGRTATKHKLARRYGFRRFSRTPKSD